MLEEDLLIEIEVKSSAFIAPSMVVLAPNIIPLSAVPAGGWAIIEIDIKKIGINNISFFIF